MQSFLKEVAAENRRKRTIDDTSPMTDDEIDIAFKYATFCLGLADDIYAKCMAPAGSLSEDDLQDIESTVRDFSKAWRAGNFPSTPKFHTIEKHLVRDYLRRFRGLKEYEESFMERSHQIFSNYESKSRCETSYFKKAILHNKWDRRDEHPKVKKALKTYELKRKKRSDDDPRTEKAKRRRKAKKEETIEKRSLLKIECNNDLEDE
ncbi:predicted protein [Chaetoceros tenuissimus]|uniref:Uncharacterized protein n=2 Tax=Chaetoceros tenuissimus TaxID=426638 RepID=A0AAD3CKE5_9STRA|nr:predicted protein [Chaetoceros tenuissimus]